MLSRTSSSGVCAAMSFPALLSAPRLPRLPWRRPFRSDRGQTQALDVRFGADAELVALGIGHDHVVVFRVEVVPDPPGAEAGQPPDLGGLVVGVEVEVHLVSRGNR